MKKSFGFTLFEIVISLFLLAVVAAIAGIGAVSGFQVYVATRENAHSAQKIQLAMSRISRELIEMTEIPQNGINLSPAHIIYDIADERHAVAHVGDSIILYTTGISSTSTTLPTYPEHGNVLIDNVDNFALQFYQGASSWALNSDLRLLSAIKVDLSVSLRHHSMNFETILNPRNCINYGGASVPATIPTHLSSAYCFIETVKSGLVGKQAVAVAVSLAIMLGIVWLRIRKWKQPSPPKGSALIGIIIAMMVFSAVAAVMLPIVSTSIYTQAGGNSSTQAYYLAESGYRYAASRYLNATASEGAKNDQLRDMNGKTYHLAGGQDSFEIDIFAYYFETIALPSGNVLNTRIPGSSPYDTGNPLPSTGRIKVGPDVYEYTAVDTSALPLVDFTIGGIVGSLPLYPLQTNVFLVATGQSASQTPGVGYSITLESGSGDGFPVRNGEVIIGDDVFAYRKRGVDQLIGIFDPQNPYDKSASLSFDFSNNSDIVLHKYIRLYSTGSTGSGAMATSRKVTYNTPLPIIEAIQQKVVFHDPFDPGAEANWGSAIANLEMGTFDVESIDGDYAFNVTGYETYNFDTVRRALKALNWQAIDLDLAKIHEYADNYLSYDVQVKVGFEKTSEDPVPDHGWYPAEPIPRYFAAGLVFRLDPQQYSYGLSFVRGIEMDSPFLGYKGWNGPDNLEGGIVPMQVKPIICLWHRSNSTPNQKEAWLAYKKLETVFFEEDAEGDDSNWSQTDTWSIDAGDAYTGDNSWHESPGGDYSNDMETILQSQEIDLDLSCACVLCSAELYFWHRHALAAGDVAHVEYSTDSGTNWLPLESYSGYQADWTPAIIPIGDGLSGPVLIRFRLQTDSANVADGWRIDDIRVAVDRPMINSTLAVRLQESAVLEFKDARTEIFSGIAISGPNGAGIADGAPMVSAGDWVNGASGMVLLKKVTGTFSSNQNLSIGSYTNIAKVDSYRARENLIKAYYATESGCKSANTVPFDIQMAANERGTLYWPPDEGQQWSTAKDHFQLIKWDAVNPQFVKSDGSGSAKLVTYGDEADAILRSWDGDLLTENSTFTVLTRPELGLHSFGKGVQIAYFDDYGIQAIYPITAEAVTHPIQE
jgi:type II secretory pathway pseudopilin PulG